MATIYVVVGSSGDYEGYRTWNVKAFKTEAAASVLAIRANKAARDIDERRSEIREEFNDSLDLYERLNAVTVNEYDPAMQWSYPRPGYDVEALEFEE